MLRLSILLMCNDSFLSTVLMFLKHNKMSKISTELVLPLYYRRIVFRIVSVGAHVQQNNMSTWWKKQTIILASRTTNTTAQNFNFVQFEKKLRCVETSLLLRRKWEVPSRGNYCGLGFKPILWHLITETVHFYLSRYCRF